MTTASASASELSLNSSVGDYTLAQIARLLTGASNGTPVVVVEGARAPHWEGEGFHWTTPGGKPVLYPRAYGYRTVYHHSTQRVEVGAQWTADLLARQGGAFRRDETHGVTTAVLCGSRRTLHGFRLDAGRTHDGRQVWLVRSPDGRYYHADRTAKLFDAAAKLDADARSALRATLNAFQAQDRAAREWADSLGRPLAAIWVDAAASHRAGNCPAGTDAQAARVRRALGGDVGAVRADVLLAMRDDQFTRRAVAAAAKR